MFAKRVAILFRWDRVCMVYARKEVDKPPNKVLVSCQHLPIGMAVNAFPRTLALGRR